MDKQKQKIHPSPGNHENTIQLSASTQESELVLAGDYEEADLDQLSRLFLNNMSKVTELDSQSALLKVLICVENIKYGEREQAQAHQECTLDISNYCSRK